MSEVALREYFERLLDEMDRRYQQRFESQEASWEKSALQLESYKVASNEWRGTLDDTTNRMLSRVEYTAAHETLVAKFDTEMKLSGQRMGDIDKRLSVIEGRAGYASMTVILSVVAVLIAIITALSSFFHLAAAR